MISERVNNLFFRKNFVDQFRNFSRMIQISFSRLKPNVVWWIVARHHDVVNFLDTKLVWTTFKDWAWYFFEIMASGDLYSIINITIHST